MPTYTPYRGHPYSLPSAGPTSRLAKIAAWARVRLSPGWLGLIAICVALVVSAGPLIVLGFWLGAVGVAAAWGAGLLGAAALVISVGATTSLLALAFHRARRSVRRLGRRVQIRLGWAEERTYLRQRTW